LVDRPTVTRPLGSQASASHQFISAWLAGHGDDAVEALLSVAGLQAQNDGNRVKNPAHRLHLERFGQNPVGHTEIGDDQVELFLEQQLPGLAAERAADAYVLNLQSDRRALGRRTLDDRQPDAEDRTALVRTAAGRGFYPRMGDMLT